MFQLFLWTRVRFRRGKLADNGFRARSAERDAETDRERIGPIITAIEAALQDAEKEQSGLNRRVGDALARAAVTIGNDSDEYLQREPLDDRHQSLFSAEIANGQRRLAEVAAIISNLTSMKADLLLRIQSLSRVDG